MARIVVTGATGNVGREVVRSLLSSDSLHTVVACVRNLRAAESLPNHVRLHPTAFDFLEPGTYGAALASCDTLFLLRPPEISNVSRYFKPLIDEAVKANVKHIVFLSVQGADENPIIPHHKIERLITESGLPFSFLRPAYFMQNFTTMLLRDLHQHIICLPAGNARFTLIDTSDVGRVAATVLLNPEEHAARSYELTSGEKLSFGEMAAKLSHHLKVHIQYKSVSPLRFLITKLKQKNQLGLTLVMMMLHYLPRFKKEPAVSDAVERITGLKPKSFDEFIEDNENELAGRGTVLFKPKAEM